ncbi:MAG: hypothetical protein ACYCTH_14895, partial [Cellulomonas sp.]
MSAVTPRADVPRVQAPARPARGPARHRGLRVVRWTFLTVLGLYFLVPQLAMARFAFQNVPVVLLN